MKRALLAMLMLAGLSALVGCCCDPCKPGMGCGPMYLGAYADDPPSCEPCDGCGNWTGCCDPCKGRRPPHFRHGVYHGPVLTGECCWLKKIIYELKANCNKCDTCCDGCGGGFESGPMLYHGEMGGPPMMSSPPVMHSTAHHGSNCNCH